MNQIENNKFLIFISSKDSNKKIEKIEIEQISTTDHSKNQLTIQKDKIQQKILGFGGAFTESSASIYKSLRQEQKEEIIEAYFGLNGNKYNMGRSHINSCDFSLNNYAHCQTPGDIELKTFSIDRDKQMTIPFIKDAMDHACESIKILASPWSPPLLI